MENWGVDKITNNMAANGIIKEEEQELYGYGMWQGVIMLLNIFAAIGIGLFLNMVWQSLLFLAIYSPLRMFAGGWHARTESRCFAFSIVLVVFCLLMVKHLPQAVFLILALTLMAGMIIFILAPVEDQNKPLEPIERKKYGRIARWIFIAEVLCLLLAFSLGFTQTALCIAVALAAVGGMVAITA